MLRALDTEIEVHDTCVNLDINLFDMNKSEEDGSKLENVTGRAIWHARRQHFAHSSTIPNKATTHSILKIGQTASSVSAYDLTTKSSLICRFLLKMTIKDRVQHKFKRLLTMSAQLQLRLKQIL